MPPNQSVAQYDAVTKAKVQGARQFLVAKGIQHDLHDIFKHFGVRDEAGYGMLEEERSSSSRHKSGLDESRGCERKLTREQVAALEANIAGRIARRRMLQEAPSYSRHPSGLDGSRGHKRKLTEEQVVEEEAEIARQITHRMLQEAQRMREKDDDLVSDLKSQEHFWKFLITADDISRVAAVADDDVLLRATARHFWNRAFLIHRGWRIDDRRYIYRLVVKGVKANRNRVKCVMDGAFFDTEEALSQTVKEFAEQWLQHTPRGLRYTQEVKAYQREQRLRRSPWSVRSYQRTQNHAKIPKPEEPALGTGLLTSVGEEGGFIWNIAVSTRFWCRFLASSVTGPAPPNHISWLCEDFSSQNSGSGLWLSALDSVALELIRRAVIQGPDRMHRDRYRSDFQSVLVPETFRRAVIQNPSLSQIVRMKDAEELRLVSPQPTEPACMIFSQGCSTTRPHVGFESLDGTESASV